MSAEQEPSPAMIRRVVFASVLGCALEWFDFVVYGLFAATIARLYFPASDPLASLALSLATFGVGFVVRPLGGVLLGLYGDRAGRRRALFVTMLLMSVGTGMIGLLPTYASIGLAAPILVMVARLIQGISAGGEFSGATTMLIEFAPADRRGLFGSLQMFSQALAVSCGAAVAWLLTSQLDTAQFESWGWRVPFLFGILVGPIGSIIRSRLDESPEFVVFARASRPGSWRIANAALRELFGNHLRAMVASFGICIVGTVSAYVFIFFIPIFAKHQFGIAPTDANLSTFISTALVAVFCPLTGHLSDKCGRKAVLLAGVIGYGVAAWMLFHRFVAAPSFYSLLTMQIVVSFFMSFIWGPTPVALTEIFSVGVRSTGVALTYNLSAMIFGGLAPFINTWLVRWTASTLAPIYYVEFSVLIGVAGICLLPHAARFRSNGAQVGISR